MINGGIAALATRPDAEAKRLAVLANLRILDTPPEHAFDTIVQSARTLLGCEIALVSLIDDHRQWFKAKCGLSAEETPREQAFCAHAIAQDGIFIVPDARRDARFSNNPLVTGPPHIRFYAGVPIRMTAEDGSGLSYAMGTLCVIDSQPRVWTDAQSATLANLADLVETLLHARASAALASRISEEQRLALIGLDRMNRQFGQAERLAQIGSWRITIADQSAEWSDGIYMIHGLPIGVKPMVDEALLYFPLRSRTLLVAAMAHTIETGQPFDLELDFINAAGQQLRVRSVGERECRDGAPHALFGIFQDISVSHAIEQDLRRTANRDDLTGLANRARFNAVVDERLAARRDEPLALMLIDLDYFKSVNDRFGHASGDELLQLIANRLNQFALAGCFAARLGGDEFVLLITDPAMLADLPACVRELLAILRQDVGADRDTIAVSATIGAARLSSDVRDRSDLMHRADIALYDAKRARRGSARIFGEDASICVEDAPISEPRHARR